MLFVSSVLVLQDDGFITEKTQGPLRYLVVLRRMRRSTLVPDAQLGKEWVKCPLEIPIAPVFSLVGAKYLAMIAHSIAIAPLVLTMNETTLYLENTSTHHTANRLASMFSSRNALTRWMDTLSAHLSA